MRKIVFGLTVLSLVGFLYAAPAQALAARTWVSGVGDDTNPCSRTAPCKTFSGAIAKTASGGEINVLDSGGFGAVTITKPITIASEGFRADILVSGTNGIIVNVPNATDVVVLQGLDIEGLGTGLNGITVIAGGTVLIENCIVEQFTTGINFVPTMANSQLLVTDTIVRNNGSGVTGGGIFVGPTGAGTAQVSLDWVLMENNVFGFKAQGTTNATVNRSAAAGNTNAGFSAASPGSPTLTIENSVSTHNATGIVCNAGTSVRMGNMRISDNGTALTTGGTCLSF